MAKMGCMSCSTVYLLHYSRLRLIWPPWAGQVTIITGGLYYPEFTFIKKSKFLYKSGHINQLDIQWTPLNKPTSGQLNLGLISGWAY